MGGGEGEVVCGDVAGRGFEGLWLYGVDVLLSGTGQFGDGEVLQLPIVGGICGGGPWEYAHRPWDWETRCSTVVGGGRSRC